MAAQSRGRGAESADARSSRGGASKAPDTGSKTSDGAAPAGDAGYGPGVKSPGRLALDAAFRKQADLRLGLAENLSQARTQNDPLDARVEQAFKDFDPSAPAKNEPERRNHVDPDAAPFDALDRVMRDRLDTLKAAAPRPGITIHANSSLIQWDQGDGVADDSRSGTIELGRLLDFIDKRGVASLTRPAWPALAACEAERKAQALLDGIDHAVKGAPAGADGSSPPADNGADHNAGKVADFVEKSVSEQMGSATAPEARVEYGLIPNGADSNNAQAGLLDTFELRPGPSDVTSYHDFSTLQIAFENVWTQIFDGELEALGRQVYREYVGLVDFLGYDPATADQPISSLDDLTWLIGEIRRLSQLAQDGLPPGGGGAVGTTNIPKNDHQFSKDADNFVNSLPGGRVGAGIATLGISELVLLFIRDAGTWGTKPALRWDDLVNGRTLERGDRIVATVESDVVGAGQIELVLKTSTYSHKKLVGFQVLDQGSQKFQNRKAVYNYDPDPLRHPNLRILYDSNNQPEFYVDDVRIDTSDLATGLLEFDTEESSAVGLGRYVLGDLDKIVPDGGRLTLYWTDS